MAAKPSTYKVTHFLIIILAAALFSCGREKTTLPARIYHNTTSFFNGYYNANLLFNETLEQIEGQYLFPEEGFIEVINFGSEDEIKSFVSNFEKINEKNDIVIYKHPNGKWVDDCRFLNGKSWFYRQNYTLAMQNFDEVIDKFPDSERLPEAYIWKAMTFYRMDNTEMTQAILQENIIENDSFVLNNQVAAELAIFRSRLDVESKQYQSAASTLEQYIAYINPARRRARAHFLLGQLYAQIKAYPKSLEHFSEVEKFSADYDLTFKSKIKIARLYVDFQEGKDDDSEVNKYLTKLLKDEKNEEYRDQIYYEFALLEEKKDSLDKAIDYLKLAIKANVSNQRQKALSYYKIGQIFFYDRQNYPMAQAYYDSAATSITPLAPEYKEITRVAKTLKEYITYINTIHYQDSMLVLGELPQAALDSLIDALVAEEKRRKEEETERQMALMAEQQSNNAFNNPFLQQQQLNNTRRNNSGNSGEWYFDNPSIVSNGKLQFQQLWGQRPNEDNWRRSKKSNLMENLAFTGETEEAEAAVDSTLLTQYGDKYAYYKDVPRTDEDKAKAHGKIENALYRLGQLYSQKLSEPDSAIKTFEYLLDRYEDSDFTLRARYALYQLYKEKGNPIAEVHKNYILNEHPNTPYAYLILNKDPNELKKDEEDFRFVYDGLFNAYNQKEYQTSLGFSEFLVAQYGEEERPGVDIARLQYIRGMSYGYTGEKDSLFYILTNVVSQYPESEVTPIARKTLGYISQGLPPAKAKAGPGSENPDAGSTDPGAGNLKDPANPLYNGFADKPAPNDKIFVLMYVDKTSISKSDATTKVSDFNKELYKDQNLKVFTFLYKDSHLLPYISNFKDIESAKKYINDFQASAFAKEIILGPEDKIFYISHTNFKVAYGQKRMTDYIAYYENILGK